MNWYYIFGVEQGATELLPPENRVNQFSIWCYLPSKILNFNACSAPQKANFQNTILMHFWIFSASVNRFGWHLETIGGHLSKATKQNRVRFRSIIKLILQSRKKCSFVRKLHLCLAKYFHLRWCSPFLLNTPLSSAFHKRFFQCIAWRETLPNIFQMQKLAKMSHHFCNKGLSA